MPRKRAPAQVVGPDWFLSEWMTTQGVTQSKIITETGWGKARVSEIVNGKTNYYREIVNELSRVLNIRPYEILLHPDDAMAIRRMRDSALQIAADNRQAFTPAEPPQERLHPRRKAV